MELPEVSHFISIGRGTGMVARINIVAAEVVAGSAAWIGRGLSCVCAQRRDSDARPSFDLTLAQEECLEKLESTRCGL
ncbi:hypothetical protein PHJA_002070700 [Phtheirospermum japonicum]|uniref:Uncharacterized protein n=1 Tax=Phtheirospermum japonicum TaxID=374723 RepID=A0A830CP60_9LAMI|nr:hypothetical protein PHJA_002070700 [Phtheirospermum japonicum]